MIDDDLLDAWPKVRLDADNAAFYRGLTDNRLLINRCGDCGAWHHPPRPVCPRCWSWAVEPTEAAGTGTIALVTVLRQGRKQPGTDFSDGFAVIAVELDEQPGLRLTGTVVNTPPGNARVGQRVRLVWPTAPDQPPYPDFEVTS
ncbi:MAG: Zn-ribbon domain-containing OB-fold protein [Acidimicrobiia bacterium]